MTTVSSSRGFERQSTATATGHGKDEKKNSSHGQQDAIIYNPSKKVRQEENDLSKKKSFQNSKPVENIVIKKKVILPDPKLNVDPDVYLSLLVEAQFGFIPTTRAGLDMMNDFFPQVTEEHIAAYETALVVACRSNDVAALRSLHTQQGKSMNACNRFGESLLHMACRRGFVDLVHFLLETCDVRILDDCGRTPLHDAFWNPTPQLEICAWLIERDPCLLLIKDKRGSTPFQYARPQDWPTWRQFLLEHCQCLESLDRNVFSKGGS